MSELPRSWEFGHHTPTAHQGFLHRFTSEWRNPRWWAKSQLWYCISQESGLAGAPSNMADRVLCPIQHGGQKILCHDPRINQYGGPNLLRETYIKGGSQLLRGQSNKDTELRTLSYRRLYQTNQLSSRQNL